MPHETRHDLPLRACPGHLRHRHVETEVVIPRPRADVWRWLCDPATFVDGQVWPWRVEFIDPVTGEQAGFAPGVLTNHHGPGMSFPGVIGAVREPEYRDLAYVYGAFLLSPRICRPVRLQMHLDDHGDRTVVRIVVDVQVRRGLGRLSDAVQRLFWRRFARWGTSAIG